MAKEHFPELYAVLEMIAGKQAGRLNVSSEGPSERKI